VSLRQGHEALYLLGKTLQERKDWMAARWRKYQVLEEAGQCSKGLRFLVSANVQTIL
jgi:hypothetical protein